MAAQKSQKGRLTAAPQTEEVTRRRSGPIGNTQRGRQQFGGVAQRTDRDVDRLSGRSRRALEAQVSKSKAGGGQ